MLSHLIELTSRTKITFLIHHIQKGWLPYICTQTETSLVWVSSWRLRNIGGGFGYSYRGRGGIWVLVYGTHTKIITFLTRASLLLQNTNSLTFPQYLMSALYLYHKPSCEKAEREIHSILGRGEGVMHILANSICCSNSTHTCTYSFTYVEHSQYIVLIWQEDRCVDSHIVVQCRHHVSEVVKTILLEHLQIHKILAHSSNGLYQCKSCTSYNTDYK
jgi:hypothetical protein